ncbi:MAG: fructose-bisphosphatase class III [Eubacteriales bacterium]|nr:fructose-bisphosphatase class III [Eubacteriales bacterium]
MATFTKEQLKYLNLLSEQYPNTQSLYGAIGSISAKLALPKGTDHFISDLHGEYEAFEHILNNCSGVIKEKATQLFGKEISQEEINEFCTIIYYPKEKLELLKENGKLSKEKYKKLLLRLTTLAKFVSVKYTRQEVRDAIPSDYYFILDELLNTEIQEHQNQQVYHDNLIETLISIGAQEEVIQAFAKLIKKLAVNHLYVLGDIFDRGPAPDKILDMLMCHHAVNITWGNHDALWMGAAALNPACIAACVRNTLNYGHLHLLESGYGISMRPLYALAQKTYPNLSQDEAALKTITIIMFKLEGQLIKRNPEFKLDDRLKLHLIDKASRTISYGGNTWPLIYQQFPTLLGDDWYKLSDGEQAVMEGLRNDFEKSEKLNRQIRFLYDQGSVYRIHDGSLLLHGCIPLKEDGTLLEVTFDGNTYSGQSYLDYCDKRARDAFRTKKLKDNDFMWFLWCGDFSPLCGRKMATFAHIMIADRNAFSEPRDPYYTYNKTVEGCEYLLKSFNLNPKEGHIINGHTPVLKGQSPLRAGGRIIVIDGGFCKAYQKKTGIAGYTLLSNSHGMRIVAHDTFESVENAVSQNTDINATQEEYLPFAFRQTVGDSDAGEKLKHRLHALHMLLEAYRKELIRQQ